jgi:uncharacterized damage-inducible protein DinB
MTTGNIIRKIEKPVAGEFPPYAIKYINLLPNDELVLHHLKNNIKKIKEIVFYLPPEKLNTRLAEGKWTIKETLIHIMDVERIYSYRALCIARNDKSILPGMEQDAYVMHSRANERTLNDIVEEYEAVRYSTLCLFNNFDEEALRRKGNTAAHEVSVRALAYLAAGHEAHHINSIQHVVHELNMASI